MVGAHEPGDGEDGEDKPGQGEPRRPMSVRPSAPSFGRPSLGSIHGGARANYRILFAAVWLAAQAALLVTASRRGYGPFDFRAASESLVMKLVLQREIEGPDGQLVRQHVDDGMWSARGRDGRYHRQVWFDRVPRLGWTFDREVPVAGGSAVALAKAQAALDDVTGHLPFDEDAETHRLFLEVTVRRNGHEAVVHPLASRDRFIGGRP